MTIALTPSSQRPTPFRDKAARQGLGLTVLAWAIALFFFIPFLWMVLVSFRSETDAATNPPQLFAPFSVEGYRNFFGADPWGPLLNSATASGLSTALVILLAFPAAYALSIRPVKKWQDVLF